MDTHTLSRYFNFAQKVPYILEAQLATPVPRRIFFNKEAFK
jgi:hypothetical protein